MYLYCVLYMPYIMQSINDTRGELSWNAMTVAQQFKKKNLYFPIGKVHTERPMPRVALHPDTRDSRSCSRNQIAGKIGSRSGKQVRVRL